MRARWCIVYPIIAWKQHTGLLDIQRRPVVCFSAFSDRNLCCRTAVQACSVLVPLFGLQWLVTFYRQRKHIQCRTEIMPDTNLKAIYQAQFWRLLPFGSLQIHRCSPRLSTRLHCLCNLLLQEWGGETFEHLKTFEDCYNVA